MVGVRLEPDVYENLQEYVKARGGSEAEALRVLVRQALETEGLTDPLDDPGYAEGLRRGRADFHRALNEAWKKVNK